MNSADGNSPLNAVSQPMGALQYLVGTRRRKPKQFEAELLKDDFEKIRPDVEVKHIPIPGREETYILCRTKGRKEKEKAIRSRCGEDGKSLCVV